MTNISCEKAEVLWNPDTMHCSWSVWQCNAGALCLLADNSAGFPRVDIPQDRLATGDKALAESCIWQRSLSKLFSWPGEVDDLHMAPDPNRLKPVGCIYICLYKHLCMKSPLRVGRNKRSANTSWGKWPVTHAEQTQRCICVKQYLKSEAALVCLRAALKFQFIPTSMETQAAPVLWIITEDPSSCMSAQLHVLRPIPVFTTGLFFFFILKHSKADVMQWK